MLYKVSGAKHRIAPRKRCYTGQIDKRHFGESAVRIEDYDEEKNIYKISGISGDLEPIYFWHQLLVSNTESNLPSQQMKRDAVDFWGKKDRTVYYVNSVTGKEELLSNDINSMERLFEEEWYLKIECKSESDVIDLAADLAEWTEYALRKSPYVWEWGIGFSKVTKAHLLDNLQVVREERNERLTVDVDLFILYRDLYMEGNIEMLKEGIENSLLAGFTT